ncbi:NAD(P)-binding protein [Sistotremastrum suecicum HHB10207 ss-3]|uniref:NAD(P)-binding protein n=1 Tax=Sistotremastrum suecicum HHB10207 ss-3 TaxID=1314776 RepID=A0A165ZFG7_9AGAM|nr:NAD(P)-binding protein [Sistotremastrum suecicum HHB10207 ss-3]
MTLRIISSTDINTITSSLPPSTLLSLMAQTFHAFSHSKTTTPPRLSITSSNHTTLFMPSRISSLSTTSVKVVSVPLDGGDKRGLPASTVLLDESSGGVRAVMNARNLTAIRTAAGSALSMGIVDLKDPRRFVAFGAGAQIRTHLVILLDLYPTLKEGGEVWIYNRSLGRRMDALVEEMRGRWPKTMFQAREIPSGWRDSSKNSSPSISSAAQEQRGREEGRELTEDDRVILGADIIITATCSTMPLIPAYLASLLVSSSSSSIQSPSSTAQPHLPTQSPPNTISTSTPDSTPPANSTSPSNPPPPPQQNSNHPNPKHTHIILIGSYKPTMHEIPSSLLTSPATSLLLVDSRTDVLLEAGEFIDAGVGGGELVEIGEVVDENGNILQGSRALEALRTRKEGGDEKEKDGGGRIVTVFKSVGIGAQDVAIAKIVYDRAVEMGLGVVVEDYDS